MTTNNGVDIKITRIPIEELHVGVYVHPGTSYLLLTKADIHKLISELNEILIADMEQKGVAV